MSSGETQKTRISESPLASWDVFHGDRLELERGLSTTAIREALARGELRDDDLVRPSGTTVAWARLADIPELLEHALSPSTPQSVAPPPPTSQSGSPGSDSSHPRSASRSRTTCKRLTYRRRLLVHDRSDRPTGLKPETESDDVSFPVIQDKTGRS